MTDTPTPVVDDNGEPLFRDGSRAHVFVGWMLGQLRRAPHLVMTSSEAEAHSPTGHGSSGPTWLRRAHEAALLDFRIIGHGSASVWHIRRVDPRDLEPPRPTKRQRALARHKIELVREDHGDAAARIYAYIQRKGPLRARRSAVLRRVSAAARGGGGGCTFDAAQHALDELALHRWVTLDEPCDVDDRALTDVLVVEAR